MEYLEPADAQKLGGLRLALTAHVPGPYSLAARAILDHHGVDYIPVLQVAAGPNEDLRAWTGHRNAPVAMYNDETARAGWLEILNLAERLGSGPSLVPANIEDRMRMIGFSNELLGENGFIWSMRLVMLGLGGAERIEKERARNPMYDQYGYSEDAAAAALERARAVIERLTAQLIEQHKTGQRHLVGDRLTALDIYWAYFSQAVQTLPDDICPMPRGMRKAYEISAGKLGDVDPILVAQRDWVFAEYALPLDF